MKELAKNSIEKSKELLGITEDIEINELYDKLYDYRNSQHPDKYQDEETKKKAESNFKETGNLLESLKRELELQLVNKSPSEIVPYQDIYDEIQLKQKTVDFQDEIRDLKQKLSSKVDQITDLKKELKSLRLEKLDEKKDELRQQYTPTKKSIFSNGIIFILTLITSIFTKVEEIADFISKYSPIPENIFNYILFGILLFIPVRYFYTYLKQQLINQIAQLIVAPPMIQLFLEKLKDKKKNENFSEINVYNFMQRIKYPRYAFLRIIYSNIFNLKSHIVLNSLKDIFIYNLLSKQLIEISRADNLDRNFRIVKGYYHISLDDDDLDLPF